MQRQAYLDTEIARLIRETRNRFESEFTLDIRSVWCYSW